ncbi:recombinase RecT [Mesorhizobium amorphae]|uniref:recombinase RecT n=1 Tax=Mesorhizobium amorphae TaxID=71433 RepID=UPI001184004B|nr:recombinase RecT [Mesorhizobium amorphae]
MNQLVPADQTSTREIGIMAGANGASIAPQNLGEVVRFAEVMCRADIALPKHLRGNAGACMAVALQALEWKMSPFAVASKSYSVNGQIAYEAQLIMAVINTRSGIEGRLKFRFEGEGQDRVCVAFGKLDGEELEVRSPKFKDITPKNSPLWKSDPDQQHCYYTGRAWGRRHTPEVILGVYDREEVEQFRDSENARDVTPSLADRLKLARIEQHDAAQPQEGFTAANSTADASTLTGEPASSQTNPEQETSSVDTGDDAGSGGVSSSAAAADLSDTGNGVEAEAGDIEAQEEPDASSASEPIRTRADCIKAFMTTATDPELDVAGRRDLLEQMKDWWKADLPNDLDFVKACLATADKVAKGELGAEAARKYLEGLQ